MADLVWTPIAELGRMLASKAVSPVEIVQAHLDRIARLDPTLRAYVTVCGDAALREARTLEAELMRGRVRGPLHGVPVAVKDLFHTGGVRTTAGSRMLADFVPATDATVVARLRAAGAVVLGKLNMHEFAYGAEGWNELFGDVRNPWDAATHRMPGGSSAGSAAAVAAALAPAALGSDTGGSIRLPATLCGITGLKPTYGRVSRSGVVPLAWSMDHVGPLARTVTDCALVLGAIAGPDREDETTAGGGPVPDYAAALGGDLRGVRVGLLGGFFVEGCDGEIAAAVRRAAAVMEGLGARVEPVELPSASSVGPAFFAIIACESLAYHGTWLRTRPEAYSLDVRTRLMRGAFVSGVQYVRAQQFRRRMRDELDAALGEHDVLVAPGSPVTAPAIRETHLTVGGRQVPSTLALISLTSVFSFAGHPVCAVPCGFSAGLPVGMQVVGRPFDESTVLRVSHAYQDATDWHRRRPPLAEA